ncbi:MAG: hypothetical protein LBN26_09235 [Christensenellaceae bacterium]|jgi:predicted RNA-binding Zn-ribbon protein involved in translation (DUF1610 family)|nr:hypothetical protein [Christensenellaceae bacterium]
MIGFQFKFPKKGNRMSNTAAVILVCFAAIIAVSLFIYMIYGHKESSMYKVAKTILIAAVALIVVYVICTFALVQHGQEPNGKGIPYKVLYDDDPLYVHLVKHHCPQCGSRLTIGYDGIIVHSASPEAKNYDFSTANDVSFKGNLEFRKCHFACPNCGFAIPFPEMRKLEREQKKLEKEQKKLEKSENRDDDG